MFSVRNKLIRFIACWTAIHMASLKLMIIHSIGCSVKTIYFEHFQLLSAFEVRVNGRYTSPAPSLWPFMIRAWLRVMCLVHITLFNQAICTLECTSLPGHSPTISLAIRCKEILPIIAIKCNSSNCNVLDGMIQIPNQPRKAGIDTEAFIESGPESCFQLSGGDQMVLSFGCNGPLCMYDKIPDHVQTLAGKNWTTIALILGLQLVEKMWEVPSTRFSTPKIAGNADRGLDTKW